MKGKVYIFGDNIDTDIIAPGGVLHKGMDDIRKHSMEAVFPDFYRIVRKEDIAIAGRNFGCGSSREQAPLVLKELGISLVLARSFSRIFYRNAVNVGLRIGVIDEEIPVNNGDEVSYSTEDNFIKLPREGKRYKFQGPSGPVVDIINAGGLVEYVRNRLK